MIFATITKESLGWFALFDIAFFDWNDIHSFLKNGAAEDIDIFIDLLHNTVRYFVGKNCQFDWL